MNHTVVFQNGKNSVSRRAYGYSKENNKLVQTDQSSTSATLGDGGIYSNVEDLAKWDEGLRNHTLLSEKEMEPAFTPGKLNDGSLPYWPKDPHDTNKSDQAYPILYGFGWFLDPYHGHTRIYHDGESMGFRTTIQRFVDNHFTVIVLSNRTDLNPNKFRSRPQTCCCNLLLIKFLFCVTVFRWALAHACQFAEALHFARAAMAPYCFIIVRICRYCLIT